MSFTYAQVSSLNETEAQVYNYVMMNRDKVMDESIRELAHDTHVSTATVIRFCKKMGCSGFLELKYKLKDHIHTQSIKAKQDSTNFMSFVAYTKLDIENPIIRINTAFKGCSSLEKISVLPRIYHN